MPIEYTVDLIIFDLDGTLAVRDTGELLPGVGHWFKYTRPALEAKVAIASNQGGVGLRYWMESAGFGEPEKYPTAATVSGRLIEVMNALEFDGCGIDDAILAFAYESKSSGMWAPTPDIYQSRFHSAYGRWPATYRKPAPGMLEDFMREYKATPERTLMVGDSEEDKQAAAAAGCKFIEADLFFTRLE